MEATWQFIREHRQDDVRTLALQASKYPSVDMPTAIRQIAGWQTAREKLPTWAACEEILYPHHLALEQCSSELTARYKADILKNCLTTDCPRTQGVITSLGVQGVISPQAGIGVKADNPNDKRSIGFNSSYSFNSINSSRLTDLTGGFGVDCALLAPLFTKVTYVEQQKELCEIAAHNFRALGLSHISICCEECIHHLQAMKPVDWIFIDPARRDGHGGKTIAIADCTPDVSALEGLLLQKASHVLIKLSPMLDLSQALHDLAHVSEAHVVAVGNECKELLLLLSANPQEVPPADEVPIKSYPLTFTRRQERDAPCLYASHLKHYLYEPNAALLKAGAFRTVSHIYKVEKLHPNSHLYTSDKLLTDFPGRKFEITAVSSFNKKEFKAMMGEEKRANLSVRNFPATVAQLRHRLKLAEGGTTHLFATTLSDSQKVLIRCRTIYQ